MTAIEVRITDGKILLELNHGSVIYQTPVKSGRWYMATIGADSDHTYYYLNGKLLRTEARRGFDHSKNGAFDSKIGATRKNDRFFKGYIDDLNIYNICLNDKQIQKIYAGRLTP